jgi:hypothetical protein
MSQITKFAVLPIFRGPEGKLTPLPLRIVSTASADDAKRKAGFLGKVLGGAVAFAATYHPQLDVLDRLEILARYGQVPEGWEADFSLPANGDGAFE